MTKTAQMTYMKRNVSKKWLMQSTKVCLPFFIHIELHHETEIMYPYSQRSKSLSKAELNDITSKMDKMSKLRQLKGDNISVDFETGITADDMHNLTSNIMRRIKFYQLKKMRMGDFKRRARISLRQK